MTFLQFFKMNMILINFSNLLMNGPARSLNNKNANPFNLEKKHSLTLWLPKCSLNVIAPSWPDAFQWPLSTYHLFSLDFCCCFQYFQNLGAFLCFYFVLSASPHFSSFLPIFSFPPFFSNQPESIQPSGWCCAESLDSCRGISHKGKGKTIART